jgi:hypothetical protein
MSASNSIVTLLRQTAGVSLAREPVVEGRSSCCATTKQGERCRAPALRDGHLCLAHSGKTKLDSRKGAAKSAEVRKQRALERKENLRDKLARRLEEHADEVFDAYLRGIRSRNEAVAFRAAETLVQRVYGKPVEYVASVIEGEVTPEDIARMSRGERRALLRDLSERFPDVAARILGPQAVRETDDSRTPTPTPPGVPP